MPICPTCGAYVKEGVSTCSCGTKFIVNEEEEMKRRFREEEIKIEQYKEFEKKALDAYDKKIYAKSLLFSTKALNLNLGSDAVMLFIKGKSLFHMNRFYDSIECFNEYIAEYKDSFYRFSDISEAYKWRARAQWQLGNGFASIKSYYKALEHIDRRSISNDEKNEIRFNIREERQDVINSSTGHGIANPRLGPLEYEVFDALEKINPDLDRVMQNLYDAMSKVEKDDCKYDSIRLEDGKLVVYFNSNGECLKKYFDGNSTFRG